MTTATATSKYGLAVRTPALMSVGPLAFGPEGILFVADNAAATIFAIDLGDMDASGPWRSSSWTPAWRPTWATLVPTS
jgi:hypothetical protein